MLKYFYLLFGVSSFLDCFSQFPFKEVDKPFVTEDVIFPSEYLTKDVLFIGNHNMITNMEGKVAAAKQDHDFTGYIAIDGRSDSGFVIVNHEHIIADDILGDGGGMTVFTAYKDKATGRWQVANHPNGKFRNVDFSEVGGTITNCGGIQTPWGTVLTAEENLYRHNLSIYKEGMGIRDTSDFLVKEFNGKVINQWISKNYNYSWMVEVDVLNAKAIRKHYEMGRYSHEAGVALKDKKTVFLTDDTTPGFIFKFVAENAEDLSKGQLFVYKQNADGVGGSWLAMPMILDSLIYARQVAASLGATMFIRTEWAEEIDGKIYFTETGNDDTGDEIISFKERGATLSKHLYDLDAADGSQDYRIHDYYGRILTMDMETGHLEVFLEGGGNANKKHLANPDCLAHITYGEKTYLVIHEDLNNFSHGRVPSGVQRRVNEIWWLDMSIENPTVNDLKRFLVGPVGCETTGGRFTPSGDTYFLNIQHPDELNAFPYNNSVTIAISGFVDAIEKANNLPKKQRKCCKKKKG